MCFRQLLAPLIAISIVVSACSREREPSAPPIQVKLNAGGDCLENFGARLNDYLNERMNAAQIGAFWECTAEAVREYQRLTSGDLGRDAYSPEAVRFFLQKYFIKDRALSDGLLAGLMEVKRVFLAGQSRAVTDSELRLLQDFIAELKSVTIELGPHVKILFGSGGRPGDRQVDAAADAFERALARIGRWLHTRNQDYGFEQMRTFVAEIRGFAGSDNEEMLRRLERGISVLPPSKTILISGSESVVAGHEWVRLMTALGRGFRVYLGLKYAFVDHLNAGLVRRLPPLSLVTLSQVLRSALEARPSGEIALAEFERLFVQIEAAGWLPDGVKAEALSGVWVWLTTRLLNQGEALSGFGVEQVSRLEEEAWNWLAMYDHVTSSNHVKPRLADEFVSVLSASAPLNWDDEGRVNIVMGGQKDWAPETRLRMLWPFVLLRWAKESYVGASPKFGDDDIMRAAEEILPMLQRFGWLTATQTSIGKRLLREADLFTLGANGDFNLDLAEATRYLVFVASAYRASELWLEQSEKVCGSAAAVCVRRAGFLPETGVLSPFPDLRIGLTEAGFSRYMRQAEETILGKVTTGDFGVGDLLQVWMLFQYVETFLRRYDENHTATINLAEALEAYKTYGPTLGKLLPPVLTPDDVLAFFTFLMKYSDTPFTMFGGEVLFHHWRWHRNDWAFEADRRVLMSILNQLSKF